VIEIEDRRHAHPRDSKRRRDVSAQPHAAKDG
jgi:hypothetical protein